MIHCNATLYSTLNENTYNKNIQSVINEELSKVNEWLNINKLLLNKNKSKYIIFRMPNKSIETLTLKIDNKDIEKVDEFNFLGLTFDTNLTKKNTEKYQISVPKKAY